MKPRSGGADPDPEPAELLGRELVDDRAEAVVAARSAALAEPELAERQGEVVGDDQEVAERRVLAGEDLPDREARVVHEGQRLDERQVEAPESAHRDRRGVPRPALARPAGPVGEPVEDHPADVVARLRVLVARVAQADDDLHSLSRRGGAPGRAWTPRRTGPIPSREGPQEIVSACAAVRRGQAPSEPAAAPGPASRASSAGSAWSQPQSGASRG